MQRFLSSRPFQRLFLHHFQIALQYRQGRTQLMANVGEKVTSGAFKLMHLRHIARHHQELFIGIRHDADLQMPPGIEHQMKRTGEITRF
ncbi:Uncharacterised protein [Salmonella enterica subsp. enterica serovar Bovismorbificans]|uniref:Uncharacterized protein n=1 Tax=Salmonella enterica subsp. enterica serovar Bovismorbificans TaxID=58097 RepID=A0A655BV48_SALET|nr:Uncharacterised protein [Salmonella enterica subsp. enterica serovar Bovismorbificans]